jgi:peptidoglycan/xylan/chitin deacetylase (PgdA/CDA1 family)
MGKARTWAATGAVAAALAGVGAVVDGRARSRPLATLVGATCALAYLVGTFLPRARVFGSCVDTEPIAGTFALTFDDGPDPRHTPAISQALAARGHRATFFVLGRAVRAYPELAAQVVADGHELACHGDDHRLLAFASPREVRRQIAATERAVRGAVGRVPARFFRPPHGVRSPWLTRVVRRCGYRVCAWDGSIFDTAEPGVDVIARRVEQRLRPGAIILLHDGDGSGRDASRAQTVDALPAILDRAEERGLRSVRLSALAPEADNSLAVPLTRST